MTNPHLLALYRRMETKYSIDAQSMGYAEWICRNTTLRGRDFNFSRYPFQRQIADDMHKNLVCEKLSQVGLTEVQVRKALAVSRRNSQAGINVMFTLATDDLFEKVSTTRFRPIVDSDPVFNLEEDAKAIRNKNILQFGRSFLYLTGATESDATSTSVDVMFNDELDLTNQEMAALFASRLQGSDWRIRQQFSTPTFTAYGVNALMAMSDYHEYVMRCECCNHIQIPMFERRFCNIPGLPSSVEDLMEIDDSHLPLLDLNNAFVRCERCSKPLDLDSVDLREWVARHPGRPMRGYKVRPFSTGRLDISYIVTELLNYKRKNKMRRFKNTVLGEADDGGSARLSLEDIQAAFASPRIPEINNIDPVFVGIDSGQICTIVLGKGTNGQNADPFLIEFCHIDKLVDRVKEICVRYNVVAGAMDRHPYEPDADRVFAASGGKIWPVEYRGTKELAPVKAVGGDVITHWQVDRTTHLDQVQSRIRARTMTIAGYGDDVRRETLTNHLRNMVRIEEPEVPATWQKLDENDHFFHALAFMLTATKLPELISIVNKDEVRATVGVVAITTPAPSVVLPGFSPNHNKSSRTIERRVYQ